ncbi:MAG: hypothetical protein ABJE95_04445 [Byssovorax sp.]
MSTGLDPLALPDEEEDAPCTGSQCVYQRVNLRALDGDELLGRGPPALWPLVALTHDDSAAAPGPSGEAAGDYLPRLRTNNKRSINLIFNTPGSGLGGPAIDHLPTGTKFQRLDVPTDAGHPSIDVKLWSQDGNGKFLAPAGTMKFVCGSIQSKTGDTRVGWMGNAVAAIAALVISATSC